MTASENTDHHPFEILQLAFKSRRLAYFANNTGVPVDIGVFAVVSVDRGEDMGKVVAKLDHSAVSADELEGHFLRMPEDEDIDRWKLNREFEREVFAYCATRVQVRSLEMRLTDCEVQLDRNRIRIFFTADQRTDFRGLVRDMASAFRARIEMRQIGVRDDAKHKGGVGICGRGLCCAGFLNDFKSVTLKSVRDQGLSPNPSKVSGACSRLMCCLEYETDFYRRAQKTFPRDGMKFKLAGRQSSVRSCDIFKETVSVVFEDDGSEEIIEIEEFHRRRTMAAPPPPEEKKQEPVSETKLRTAEKPADENQSEKKQSKGRRRHRRKKSRKEERKN